MNAVVVRSLSLADDMEAITELIHAAYARHACQNLRYGATHQTAEDTAKRYGYGHGLIAELNGDIVGTLTVRPPQPGSAVELFRDPATWTLLQDAVQPALQGKGIGRMLHQAAMTYVRAQGGKFMALDTAEPASDLIEMYKRWGYQVVGSCDWRPNTNYLSVLMSRPI